jgi:hypothetical protein
VKLQLLLLPDPSHASHVTVVTPTENAEPLAGTLTRLVTVQLSLAVTVQVTLLLLQSPVSAFATMFVGQVITGGVVSRTMTRCWELLVFPLVSVTIQITTLVPSG